MWNVFDLLLAGELWFRILRWTKKIVGLKRQLDELNEYTRRCQDTGESIIANVKFPRHCLSNFLLNYEIQVVCTSGVWINEQLNVVTGGFQRVVH